MKRGVVPDGSPPQDEGRLWRTVRQLLVALLLAVVALTPAGQPLTGAGVALADDDDGGDDDDGPGAGNNGRSFGGASSSRERKTERRAVKKTRKAQAPAPRPRPVLVVLDLPEQAQAQARRRGFTVLSDERLEVVGVRVQRLRLPRNMSVASARRILSGLGAAESDVNSIYRPQQGEPCAEEADCDPRQLVTWPVTEAGSCGAGAVIGLVETAVDATHPALAGQQVEVIDVRPADSRRSGREHGTAVAALIAGSAAGSPPGLLPGARLVAAVPYYRSSQGQDVAQAFDVVRAIDALLRQKPHVINMSMAGPANSVLERAVAAAVRAGVPVVAAAGNAGSRAKPLYPAAYTDTVAVTAVSGSLAIYRRAVRGDHIDIAAPGVGLDVAVGNGKTAKRSGTSFAAPWVTSSLALRRLESPGASVEDLVKSLTASARDLGDPGRDRVFGWGLLQVQAACATTN